MFIQSIVRYRRIVILCLLPLLTHLLLVDTARTEEKLGDEGRSTNLKWKIKDDTILVNYDLISSTSDRYEVSVVMKREGDPSFAIVPQAVEGDIGKDLAAGTDRTIVWYYRRDYPLGFQGEGYYFEIEVRAISQPNNMIYYLVGAAAVTGGVIALLLGGKQESAPGGSSELPPPPGRP